MSQFPGIPNITGGAAQAGASSNRSVNVLGTPPDALNNLLSLTQRYNQGGIYGTGPNRYIQNTPESQTSTGQGVLSPQVAGGSGWVWLVVAGVVIFAIASKKSG